MRKNGLKPIFDKNTKILILGSLPSDESIKNEKYYDNPRNDFWILLGNAINIKNLADFEYKDKKYILKEHKIGLWDVFESGERDGSLDSKMKNTTFNDFSLLKKKAQNLKLICFNGKKAGLYEPILDYIGYKTKILLSSSGANRRYEKNEERTKQWGSVINSIN